MGSLFVKGGYYFLGVQQIAGTVTADIVAYGGYKFVRWVFCEFVGVVELISRFGC